MKTEDIIGKTIVISGGSSGIGLELVRRLKAGNTVVVLGRDKQKLATLEAQGISTFSIDIAQKEERQAFFRWLDETYPEFDMLINNAGWQGRQDLTDRQVLHFESDEFEDYELELQHNLEAHIGMTLEALPRLMKRPESVLVNVTTGLIYNPKATSPFYCAAKAGLHSFTQSLRQQTKDRSLRVIEVMPPLVNTPFHKEGLPDTVKAMTAESVARQAIEGIKRQRDEVRIGLSGVAYWMNRLCPTLGLYVVNR